MARRMVGCALLSVLLTVIFIHYSSPSGRQPFLALAITCGTIAYHFCMRLAVGGLFQLIMRNHVNVRRSWFQVSSAESRLYDRLQVHQWKRHMPTFNSTLFDPRLHTWEEIAQAMCQAQLVHEVIIPLSLLPILAAIRFGELPVFLLTSIAASGIDLMFVILQRYNRPRIISIAERMNRRTQRKT